MKGAVDRFIGAAVLVLVAPTLLLIAAAARAAFGGPILEEHCRVHRGRVFRTRRFRTDESAFGRAMRQYRLNEMPVALDLAFGSARLVVETDRGFDGRLQKAFAIAAPSPTTIAQPTRHKRPHISMAARGE